MQNSLVKRNFLSRIDSLSFDEQECGYQAPRKLVKRCLQIEIPESQSNENIPPPIPSLCSKSSKFVFSSLLNLQTCKASTSTPTKYDTTPKSFDLSNIFTSSNTKYDDFYEEEEFYNIAMKKCHRKTMEDRATCEKILDAKSKTSFFGIYDGHRNSYASDFLQKNLHRCILSHSEFQSQPKKAMIEAFYRIDQEICKNQEKYNIQGGSTALCVLLNSNQLHIANVGDCKAVVIRNGEPITLNIEHRANDEGERQRVESCGGVIFEKKGKNGARFMVQGSLELTRSIGDQTYKKYISCEPDIMEHQLNKDDEYLIIGSDGFWNEINEKEAADLIKTVDSSKGLSKFLTCEAFKKRTYSIDNITLVAIDLKQYTKFRAMIDEL